MRKPLGAINSFTKVAGYTISLQKSIAFQQQIEKETMDTPIHDSLKENSMQ